MAGLTGWHFILILAIVLLLFGAPKLPALARSIGQSMNILKAEVKKPEDKNGADGSNLPPTNTSTGTTTNTAAGSDSPWSASDRADTSGSSDANPKP